MKDALVLEGQFPKNLLSILLTHKKQVPKNLEIEMIFEDVICKTSITN